MSDMRSIVVLTKAKACEADKKCNLDCQNCPNYFTEEEYFAAIDIAIEACLERGKE